MTNSAESQNKSQASKPVPQLHLFLSTMDSMQYIFRDGQQAIFRGGRYATSKPQYIKELMEEVEQEHPYIKIDDNKRTITEEELKPDFEARRKMREEIIAELNLPRDFGTSSQQGGAGTGIANSESIAVAAVGANEGGMAAKLTGLGTQPATLTK